MKISTSNTQYYEPAEVLISVREPYNKNTLWIHPHDGIIESKVFNKGWKVISTTKDEGLSKISLEQINNLLEEYKESINNKMIKHFGKYSSDSKILINKQKELESKVNMLEEKLEKLTRRYQKMVITELKDGRK